MALMATFLLIGGETMAKTYKMRWTDKDNAELYRIIKNFNQKRDYHFKKDDASRPYLPEKISIKDIRSDVYSRRDFNKMMNKLKRFSTTGAEDLISTRGGAVTTKWEKKETVLETKALNLRNLWRKKKLKISVEQGNLSSADELHLQPYDIKALEQKSQEEFKKFQEGIEKKLQDAYMKEGFETYKDNYLKGILNQLGGNKDLIKLVKGIDAEELFHMTAGNPDARINFMYEPQDLLTKIDVITEIIT